MAKTPVIGIILDSECEGSFSRYPYYALRKSYFDSVVKAGGMPVALPYTNYGMLKKYYEVIDGLLVPGGGFDIPPEMYGDTEVHPTVTMKKDRTNFEAELTKMCIKENKPLLGICGGMQLINVVQGGSLIQDIPSQFGDKVPHYNKDKCSPIHDVVLKKETQLFAIVNKERIGVNTSHHQGIKKLGKDLVVNAVADDELIEGIEMKGHKFCLGVQWHPEYIVTDADYKIIEAFVNACK